MGAQFEDNVARLEWVLNRYGQITEAVVYQHSANDMFLPNGEILKPEYIIAELESFSQNIIWKHGVFCSSPRNLYAKSLQKVDAKLFALREKMNERLKIAAETLGFCS